MYNFIQRIGYTVKEEVWNLTQDMETFDENVTYIIQFFISYDGK